MRELEEEIAEKKVIEEGYGNIPIMDPGAKTYRKYLFIPIVFYTLFLILLLFVLAKYGVSTKTCSSSSPICFLGTTSLLFKPMLLIFIFGLAILLLLNVGGLLYEPIIYVTFIPEAVMLMFLAFINVYFVFSFLLIIIPKIIYLYYDKKNREIIIEKI